jgi:hypothetical protein
MTRVPPPFSIDYVPALKHPRIAPSSRLRLPCPHTRPQRLPLRVCGFSSRRGCGDAGFLPFSLSIRGSVTSREGMQHAQHAAARPSIAVLHTPRHPTRTQKHDVTTLSCYHHVMLPHSFHDGHNYTSFSTHMLAQAQKRISGPPTAHAGSHYTRPRRAPQRDTRTENAAGRSQASRQLFRWSHSLLPALSRPFNSHNRGNQQQQTHAHKHTTHK